MQALRTNLCVFFAGWVNDFGGNNTRWNGYNGVTHNHYNAGQKLSQWRSGADIAIANGGKGNDCPINPARNACESMLRPFNEVHYRSDDDYQHAYKKDKNTYFFAAVP